MTEVIGVRFRSAGKVYFFDPLDFQIKRGDHVIVETARGIEYGTVVAGVYEVEDEKVVQPLKPVIRIANQRDIEQEADNRVREKEAYKICLEKIRKHGLEMKLIDAEYTFDNNKVLFYFTADGRIDFRELVKDLAGVFKTRIELRQIGVRDETKIVGGIGICGRPLCCHSYLSDFVPVSIKMAKEQNLSLNPTKISGICGRLMCCLKNEEETYEELNRRLPSVGDSVTTDDGFHGEVQSVNVLRQLVKVVVDANDEKEIREYDVERLRFKKKHGKKDKMDLTGDEMMELERLEKEEKQVSTEKPESVEPDGTEKNGKTDSPERKNRAERPNRMERRERFDRQQRPEKREKQERSDRSGSFERRERPDRRETSEGQASFERKEKVEDRASFEGREKNNDRQGSFERKGKSDRQGQFERRERPDRQSQFEKRERSDRQGQSEGRERPDRQGQSEGRERPDRQGQSERRERPDRQNRFDRRERFDRQTRDHQEKPDGKEIHKESVKQEFAEANQEKTGRQGRYRRQRHSRPNRQERPNGTDNKEEN